MIKNKYPLPHIEKKIYQLKENRGAYLYRATFEVWIDHESLKWLLSWKELTSRKVRWA